jgi:hypothetical protein
MKVAAIATILALASAASIAQTASSEAHITQISTGWGYDSFSVFLSAPLPNPAACPLSDSATVSADSPGYKAHYAAALTAFNGDFPVTLVISNTACDGSRPKIVGVAIKH